MNKATPILLILAVLVGLDRASAEDKPAPPQIAHQPLPVQIWKGFYNAKINYRYHLAEAADWGSWYRWATTATLILAVVSATGPLVYKRGWWWKGTWLFVGTLSFVVSASQLVWPYNTWYAEDRVLAGRWNEMANEWYALYETYEGLEESQVKQRIAALRRDAVAIDNDEDASRYDPAVMVKAEEDENRYQGMKGISAPLTKPDANKQAAN